MKQKKLREYNTMVKQATMQRIGLRNMYLNQHENELVPFVSLKNFNKIIKKIPVPKKNKTKNTKTTKTTTTTPTPTPTEGVQLSPLSTLLQTPSFIPNGGELRPYQLKGVSWLLQMYEQGTNCILADEMGLGKTLQTITFLSCLKLNYKLKGPSLIVVPLSVLTSWMNEFRKWSPTLKVLQLHSSDTHERERLRQRLLTTPLGK